LKFFCVNVTQSPFPLNLLASSRDIYLQAASCEVLIPIIDASGSDSGVKAILTSTSSENVSPTQRKELLKLLPQLISSGCAAGTASSNPRLSVCANMFSFYSF
jgi:hypothetical protein